LLVGDSHGGVALLKLSPNLTQTAPNVEKYGEPGKEGKILKEIADLSNDDFQKKKMEDLLAVASKWEREDV